MIALTLLGVGRKGGMEAVLGGILFGWLFCCSILVLSCLMFRHSSCFCNQHRVLLLKSTL